MRPVVKAIALSLGLSAAAVAGCSSSETSPGASPGHAGAMSLGAGVSSTTGTLGMTLNIGPGVMLTTVQYTITNPSLTGFMAVSGSIDVTGSQVISASVVLPLAAEYMISLSAIDSNGGSCMGGPANFDVLPGQTNVVALNLLCVDALDGGLVGPDVMLAPVTISADASVQFEGGLRCAAVTSLVAAKSETVLGSGIALSATGIDPTGQTSDVFFTWSATGSAGSLSNATGLTTTFGCATVGAEKVTVTAAVTGGASCPNIGSLSVNLLCDPVPEASTPAEASTEAGGEASAEASAEAGGEAGSETGAGGGGPAPCIGTNDAANCVQCFGNSNNVCTATEAILVQRDIAKGNLTAGQLTPFSTSSPSAGSCYACVNHFLCIDNTAGGPGQECQDLPSTATTLDGEPAVQACLDTLQCIVSNVCATTNPVAQCLCGTAQGSACLGAGAANGPCLQQEINGLKVGTCSNTYPAALSCTEGDPTNTQKAFSNVMLPAGMANTLMGCAQSNCQSQCTP